MLAILSPAKSLDLTPPAVEVPPRAPAFAEEASALLEVAKGLRPSDLQELMGISEALAELNHQRFQDMVFPLTAPSSLPAALAFDGDVYKGFEARTLDDAGRQWADAHIRILSGLYGLLRPLDLMHPYRLEMGTKLATSRGKNLYEFWGTRLADALDAELADHEDPLLIDLASKEYNRAVPKRALKHERLDIQFKELRDGKPRVISFFAKNARGRFARWLVDERIERRDDLKAFDADRYGFSAELSSASSWVFIRSSSS